MIEDPWERATDLVRSEIESDDTYRLIELNLWEFCRRLEAMVLDKRTGDHRLVSLYEPQRRSWRVDAYHGEFGPYSAAGKTMVEKLKAGAIER